MVATFMRNFLVSRRVIVVLAALALLALSTAAVAHGHLDLGSVQDSHCVLCMAVHTTHAVLGPAVTVSCARVQAALCVPLKVWMPAYVESLPTHDRAPPAL